MESEQSHDRRPARSLTKEVFEDFLHELCFGKDSRAAISMQYVKDGEWWFETIDRDGKHEIGKVKDIFSEIA